jgi:Flp pilus assembly protein TadG
MTTLDANAPVNSPPDVKRRATSRFARDPSASIAVEFAMLIPLFIGLVFMIAQVGLYFYFSASLYRVTRSAAREILDGAAMTQSLTAAQFRTQVLCPLLPANMSCSNVVTNIQVVTPGAAPGGFFALTNYQQDANSPLGYDLTGLTQPPMNNNLTSFCIGKPQTVVAVEVYYAMPVLGISWMFNNAATFNGKRVVFISATTAFKNEPFPTNSSYAGC